MTRYGRIILLALIIGILSWVALSLIYWGQGVDTTAFIALYAIVGVIGGLAGNYVIERWMKTE